MFKTVCQWLATFQVMSHPYFKVTDNKYNKIIEQAETYWVRYLNITFNPILLTKTAALKVEQVLPIPTDLVNTFKHLHYILRLCCKRSNEDLKATCRFQSMDTNRKQRQ